MRIDSAGMENVSVSAEKVVPRMENSTTNTTKTESVAPSSSNATAGKNSSGIETTSEVRMKSAGDRTLGEKDWIALIERANKALNGANKSFEYSIHEATKQICIKIIDRDTKEVIREIPSEKILDMVAKMWELNGLFVDERR